MSQSFKPEIDKEELIGDTVDTTLNPNFGALQSNFCGENFPTNNLKVGQLFFRISDCNFFVLCSIAPTANWQRLPKLNETVNESFVNNAISKFVNEITVADTSARNNYDYTGITPAYIFVVNDGDGKWARYRTADGNTFDKISDQDQLNQSLSGNDIANLLNAYFSSNTSYPTVDTQPTPKRYVDDAIFNIYEYILKDINFGNFTFNDVLTNRVCFVAKNPVGEVTRIRLNKPSTAVANGFRGRIAFAGGLFLVIMGNDSETTTYNGSKLFRFKINALISPIEFDVFYNDDKWTLSRISGNFDKNFVDEIDGNPANSLGWNHDNLVDNLNQGVALFVPEHHRQVTVSSQSLIANRAFRSYKLKYKWSSFRSLIQDEVAPALYLGLRTDDVLNVDTNLIINYKLLRSDRDETNTIVDSRNNDSNVSAIPLIDYDVSSLDLDSLEVGDTYTIAGSTEITFHLLDDGLFFGVAKSVGFYSDSSAAQFRQICEFSGTLSGSLTESTNKFIQAFVVNIGRYSQGGVNENLRITGSLFIDEYGDAGF